MMCVSSSRMFPRAIWVLRAVSRPWLPAAERNRREKSTDWHPCFFLASSHRVGPHGLTPLQTGFETLVSPDMHNGIQFTDFRREEAHQLAQMAVDILPRLKLGDSYCAPPGIEPE